MAKNKKVRKAARVFEDDTEGEAQLPIRKTKEIAEAHKAGKRLKTMPENVHPIAASSYPTPAKRPTNSRLNTQKFRTAFGLTIPDWKQSVSHILKQIG